MMKLIERQGVDIAIRPSTDDDERFIRSTWLRSEPRLRKAVLNHVIASATFHVACSPEVPTAIYGWACYSSGGEVLWMYVVSGMRGIGLGKALREERL